MAARDRGAAQHDVPRTDARLHRRQLRRARRSSSVRAVRRPPPRHRDRAAEAEDGRSSRTPTSVDVDLPFDVVTRSAFLDGATPATDLRAAHHDVAAIIYTSGTTGPSKGVLVPWAELYWFDIEDDTNEEGALYAYLPPYHVSGKVSLYQAAKRRSRLVIRDGFSLGEFWNDIRRYDCNMVGLLGPLARLLMLNPEQAERRRQPGRRAPRADRCSPRSRSSRSASASRSARATA